MYLLQRQAHLDLLVSVYISEPLLQETRQEMR